MVISALEYFVEAEDEDQKGNTVKAMQLYVSGVDKFQDGKYIAKVKFYTEI